MDDRSAGHLLRPLPSRGLTSQWHGRRSGAVVPLAGRSSLLAGFGLVLVLLVWAWVLMESHFQVVGVATDAQTTQPLDEVQVRLDRRDLVGDAGGQFALGLVPPWEPITFMADGYAPRTISGWSALQVELDPLVGMVVLRPGARQVLDAELIVDSGRVERTAPGQFRLAAVQVGSQIEAAKRLSAYCGHLDRRQR